MSTMGGSGDLERTDFKQCLLWDGLGILKELIQQFLLWEGVFILKELICNSFYYERAW